MTAIAAAVRLEEVVGAPPAGVMVVVVEEELTHLLAVAVAKAFRLGWLLSVTLRAVEATEAVGPVVALAVVLTGAKAVERASLVPLLQQLLRLAPLPL